MRTIVWIQSISYDGLIEHHLFYENSSVNSLLSRIFAFKVNDTFVGKDTKVLLVLDNAPCHNRLTEDTMLPKSSWQKEFIIDWLRHHRVSISTKATKAELLQLAFSNLQEKRYVVDETAAEYNIISTSYGQYQYYKRLFDI
jgi:hypothetical protein